MARLDEQTKAGMLLGAIQEFANGFIEKSKRRLLEEIAEPSTFGSRLKHLMSSLQDLHACCHRLLQQRAARVAEGMGKDALTCSCRASSSSWVGNSFGARHQSAPQVRRLLRG